MEVFLATVVVFALAVLGMSVGVIFGGRSFKGSCRGGCGQCDHTIPHECEHEDERGPEAAETTRDDAQ